MHMHMRFILVAQVAGHAVPQDTQRTLAERGGSRQTAEREAQGV